VFTWHYRELLRGKDVLWFIDNEAAAASLIRGGSGQPDVEQLCLKTHMLWAVLDMRVWIEWIDSASNVSDGLSRDGLQDAWTISKQWLLSQADIPDWTQYASAEEMWRTCQTLGSEETSTNIGGV
jgi:hypothetical protein